MPISTISAGEDEILAYFATIWAALSSPPPLIYDDKDGGPPATGDYARVTLQFNPAGFGQKTLGGRTSLGGGGSRYGRAGVLTVQLFTAHGNGLTNEVAVVDSWMDAFDGASTGSDRVDFRNAAFNRFGNVGDYYQTNLTVEFYFDRVK